MKNQAQLLVRGMSAVALAVTLLMTGCSTAAPVPAASGPAASSPQGGLPQEGIKVHGHWTIEVRNADGTIAEVRDFENALSGPGDFALSQVLGRDRSVGGWAIVLTGNPSPFVNETNPWGTILENGGLNAPTGPGYFPTLTISVSGAGPNADKLVLSGTATAQLTGSIGSVHTHIHTRPNTEAPSSTYGIATSFTGTNLATPINLVAGQQVLVTVVISFS